MAIRDEHVGRGIFHQVERRRIETSRRKHDQNEGNDDVHGRARQRDEDLLAGFSGMRSRLATPPIGNSVMSGVRMP